MKHKYLKITILIIPLIILNIISLLDMYNSKLISDTYTNNFSKQIIWFSIGYILMFISMNLKTSKLIKYSKYLYIFSIFLLVLVLICGGTVNGAKCWFNIKGISFQPSELLKITLPLFGISIIKNNYTKIKTIIYLLIITLIPSVLVFLEPDTGAIINYLLIFIVLFSNLNVKKRWYILFISIFSSIILLFFYFYIFNQDILIKYIGTSFFYRVDRLINFFNNSSYQLENALIVMGSASLFKFGFNETTLYIPEAPTDFIFAYSIGNFGLLIGFIIIIMYLIFDILLIIYKNKRKDKNNLFISSFLIVFIFHQIYNISMNLGLLPIMGIPLPFLSYGGTNTIISFVCLGLSLGILKNKRI